MQIIYSFSTTLMQFFASSPPAIYYLINEDGSMIKPYDLFDFSSLVQSFLSLLPNLSNTLMRHGVDGFSPSSWEPQEEGMMSTAASFSLGKKPRFVSPGKSQTPEGDAD
jgi:hypothetical protein